MKRPQRFIPYRKFNGFIVPNILAKSGLCTIAELLVYGRLAQFAGKDGDCRPSISTLAIELSISRPTVFRAIIGLEAKRLIEIERPTIDEARKEHIRNKYYFLEHPVLDPKLVTNLYQPSKENIPGLVTNLYQAGNGNLPELVTNLYSEENHKENHKENHTQEAGVCDKNKSFSSEEKDSVHRVSGRDLQFINYHMAGVNSEVKNKGAYRAALINKAKAGELVYSDEDFTEAFTKAAEKAVEYRNLLMDEALNVYIDLVEKGQENVTLEIPSGGTITLDRYFAIELLETNTTAQHQYDDWKKDNVAREKINQRLSEGMSINEIIEKISSSTDVNVAVSFRRVLEHDYPEQWKAAGHSFNYNYRGNP